MLEYEQERKAVAASAAVDDAERRLERCIQLTISSPGVVFTNNVLSTTISPSSSRSGIGALPLSSAAPSYWTVSVHAFMGNDVVIGITGCTLPRPLALPNHISSIAWGRQHDMVYVNGLEVPNLDGWDCKWEPNDVAIFRYDPIPPRTISMYHCRTEQVYAVNNLPPNEYRIFIDFFESTGVILIHKATMKQQFLLSEI
mmetsp:Transcript_12871/g.12944  ORF Transcript_12871/g.12944 Transcript_12871/m.12944 type:complete len:199 (-) Transcript_12871:34-630(-)